MKLGQTQRDKVGEELTVLFQMRDGWQWKEIARFPYSRLHQVRPLMDSVDRVMAKVMSGPIDEPVEPEGR